MSNQRAFGSYWEYRQNTISNSTRMTRDKFQKNRSHGGFDIPVRGPHFQTGNMKATDDYAAKVRFWAAHQRVVPLPAGPRLPRFRPQKFSSHAEMNRWKEGLILQIARGTSSYG